MIDKIKKYAIELIVIFALVFAAWVARGCYEGKKKPDNPIVKDETPIKIVYLPGKENPQYCGNFEINGVFLKYNIFRVDVKDECKTGQKDFTFEYPRPKVYHHTVIGSYGPVYHIEDSTLRHFLSGQYLYNFGHVGVGAGAFVIFGQSKLYDIGPMVNAMAQF